MGFKEILNKIKEKSQNRKEKIRELDENVRVQRLVMERQKSANERELERYGEEDREERIKNALAVARKERQDDINFNHNPLHAENIMKSEWEILKEKNQFSNKNNMFVNQPFIHKNDRNLLKNNKKLFGI